MRIDAHVHFTPPSLAANLADLATREPYWGLLLNAPTSIQGWATPARMIADMAQASLDKVVLVGEYFQRHESCIARNNQAIALQRQYPEQIIAMATIQPRAGDAALAELARCVDAGLQGVGELNPYAQGFQLDDPDFIRVVKMCIDNNIPLNLHVSEEIGPYYLGKSTTPLRHYYDLACRYPELKLILAHWGGGLLFYELMPKVRQQLRNVWYDTAASPLLYPTADIFRVAIDLSIHHKLLYGSDYPLRLYPRRQQEADFRPFIHEIESLGLEPTILAAIMGENMGRLMGLLPSPNLAATLPATATPTLPQDSMPISLIAQRWPQTQAVFEQHGFPWQDSPVPSWEPLKQAMAARGYHQTAQQHLMDELKEAL